MNREIKFEYGFKSVNGIVKKKYYLHEIPEIKEKCDVWDLLPLVYVRQFTGLTDKNGKEIYDGDVLKHHNENIGFVRFDHGWAIEYSKNYSHDMPQYYCDYLEIIGNIYENPELL